jgi:thiol-disulfide isomerase/thioredoxin
MVHRISKGAIQKLLSGETKDPKYAAVVKVYGNGCHYCHALKESFEGVSKNFEDIFFFAFNIADYPDLERILGFNGIPTICFIQNDGKTPKIRLMPEPDVPHERTWYTAQGIRDFIEKERL